jgi:hypothetical protein
MPRCPKPRVKSSSNATMIKKVIQMHTPDEGFDGLPCLATKKYYFLGVLIYSENMYYMPNCNYSKIET